MSLQKAKEDLKQAIRVLQDLQDKARHALYSIDYGGPAWQRTCAEMLRGAVDRYEAADVTPADLCSLAAAAVEAANTPR